MPSAFFNLVCIFCASGLVENLPILTLYQTPLAGMVTGTIYGSYPFFFRLPATSSALSFSLKAAICRVNRFSLEESSPFIFSFFAVLFFTSAFDFLSAFSLPYYLTSPFSGFFCCLLFFSSFFCPLSSAFCSFSSFFCVLSFCFLLLQWRRLFAVLKGFIKCKVFLLLAYNWILFLASSPFLSGSTFLNAASFSDSGSSVLAASFCKEPFISNKTDYKKNIAIKKKCNKKPYPFRTFPLPYHQLPHIISIASP